MWLLLIDHWRKKLYSIYSLPSTEHFASYLLAIMTSILSAPVSIFISQNSAQIMSWLPAKTTTWKNVTVCHTLLGCLNRHAWRQMSRFQCLSHPGLLTQHWNLAYRTIFTFVKAWILPARTDAKFLQPSPFDTQLEIPSTTNHHKFTIVFSSSYLCLPQEESRQSRQNWARNITISKGGTKISKMIIAIVALLMNKHTASWNMIYRR